MRVEPRSAAALFLAAAFLPAAAAQGLYWIVPGVANTAGFFSDLTLTASGSQTTVTLSLIAPAGVAPPPPQTYTILPNQSLAMFNFLAGAFDYQGIGALRVDADHPLGIFARTWSPAPFPKIPEFPGLTYATALPTVEENRLLKAEETGHGGWISHSGKPDVGDRTNIAVVFPDAGGGAALLTLFDERGQSRGTIAYDVSQPAVVQKSLSALGNVTATVGRVAIFVTRGRACGYAAVVDNSSGDFSILPADRLAPSPVPPQKFEAFSSGVAQIPGRNGLWHTDARLANPGSSDASITAFLSGAAESRTATLAVSAGQTIEIPDLVQSLFQVSSPFVGAVLWRSTQPLVIAHRLRASTGSFVPPGSSVQVAAPVDTFATSTDPPPEVAGLLENEGFRTALLLAAGPGGATYELDVFDARGQALGTVAQALAPLQWGEYPLASLVGGAPVGDGARVRARVQTGALNLQAAVVDNGTEDPVLVEALPRAGASPSSSPPLAPGAWGSAEGTEGLRVDAGKIVVERWCETGTFPQPGRLDAQGRFAVLGDYAASIGPAFGFTAILAGETDGQSATVSVLNLDAGGTVWSPPKMYFRGNPYTVSSGFCPVEY